MRALAFVAACCTGGVRRMAINVSATAACSAADATVLNRRRGVDSKTKPGRSIRLMAMLFGHPRGLLGLIHGFYGYVHGLRRFSGSQSGNPRSPRTVIRRPVIGG